MKLSILLGWTVLSAALWSASPLRSQVVNDGATNTLSNVTNSFTGDVTVGTNGSFTLLVLADNALLTNSANGVIGRNATARSNEVRLISPSARWAMSNHLFVGNDGSFNRLMVSNGGTVRNNTGFVGPNAASSNNVAMVTGPGSVWSNANVFYLGFSGAGNQLVVSNGGVLQARVSNAGVNNSSSSNVAVVTGSGSLWSNVFELQFGFNGAGNELVISNGGVVRSSLGLVGSLAPASNNLVVVTGPGSLWTNTTDLFVGHSGAGNRLVVSDGGAVRNGHGHVGANTSGSNNLALVTGLGSVWSNALDLEIGAFSGNNRMIVSNGATVFTAGKGVIGPTANGNANSAIVTEAGSHWLLGNTLYVGSNGAFNGLLISNGGQVRSASAGVSGAVGWDSAGSNNLAVVTGSGSSWSNAGSFYVGVNGTANQLVVSNGGTVVSDQSFVGSNVPSSNNLATVAGPGSLWNTAGVLSLGFNSAGNRLEVNDGGVVRNSSGYMGVNSSSSNNVALVTGSGSTWSNSFELRVGSVGPGNQLVVSNGALVVNSNAFLGFTASSRSNTALVTGAGSLWSNRQTLVVGQTGAVNRVVVSDGARLESRFGTLGASTAAASNEIVVTGPGSFWRVEQGFTVGNSGSGNRLVISNGGRVRGSGTIGSNTASTNNEVVVTGAGSSWTNGSNLNVGGVGSGNRLIIRDGGQVVEQPFNVILGVSSASTNNRIVVDGGSLRVINDFSALDIRRGTNVLNAGLIDVGRLLVTNAVGFFEFNGGTLLTRGAVISNAFVVGGPGGTPAVWDVRAGMSNHLIGSALFVGRDTSFNQLLVTNGALLTSREGFIGFNAGANSNSAIVSGAGSRWAAAQGDFGLGQAGSFNSLVISNGGCVDAAFTDIGVSAGSSNNVAVVTGLGSSWSNTIALEIGESGSGNRLLISDGATVFASNRVNVGVNATSSNNLVHINGGALRAQNLAGTGTLNIRSGTNRLDAGLIDVDRLVITNARGIFEFNGGTLRTAGSTIGTGRVLTVGDGTSAATLELRGGTHVFLGGLVVANHASLTGNGTVPGSLAVQPGGLLAPGASVGKIVLDTSPSLQGTVIMEITKDGPGLTNDQIQVTTPLTYGSSLIVSNLGPAALAAGDRYRLFSAAGYSGSFSGISLPRLSAGLNWSNKLLADGSIEVVPWSGPKIGTVTVSGTNLTFTVTEGFPGGRYDVLTSTDVSVPLADWSLIGSSIFDWLGTATVTNGIAPGEPSRFFGIRTP